MQGYSHNSNDEAINLLRYANHKGILIQNPHGVFYHSPQPEGDAVLDLTGISDIKEDKRFKWAALVGTKSCVKAVEQFMELYRARKPFTKDIPHRTEGERKPNPRPPMKVAFSYKPGTMVVETGARELTPTERELHSMGRAVEALEPLDHEARGRALDWLCDRLGYQIPNGPKHPHMVDAVQAS